MPWFLGSGNASIEMITDDLARYPEDVAYAHKFVDKLKALSEEIPGAITSVEGTGLLLCAELDPEKYDVIGFTEKNKDTLGADIVGVMTSSGSEFVRDLFAQKVTKTYFLSHLYLKCII